MTSRRNPPHRLALPWETEHLRLRAPVVRDAGELIPLVGDRRISDPTTIPHPYTARDAREFVASSARKIRSGQGFDLLAFSRIDDHIAGGVGLTLHGVPHRPPWAEVGYWVAPADWGRGYASEMLGRALQAGFREYRLHRIEAWVHAYNAASVRVLTKAGFREEGRGRESIRLRGRWHDRVLLGLLADEHRARG